MGADTTLLKARRAGKKTILLRIIGRNELPHKGTHISDGAVA